MHKSKYNSVSKLFFKLFVIIYCVNWVNKTIYKDQNLYIWYFVYFLIYDFRVNNYDFIVLDDCNKINYNNINNNNNTSKHFKIIIFNILLDSGNYYNINYYRL